MTAPQSYSEKYASTPWATTPAPPPTPAAGARALRLAGAWLAVLAVLVIAFALLGLVISVIFKSVGTPEFVVGLAVVLSLFGACSLTAMVSWRAAAPHQPLAGALAFTIGALALVVPFAPAASLLLPPNGLYGLDVDVVWSATGLPWSLAVLAPAALMVFGTVSRWCVSGDAASVRRRRWIASGTTLAILASIGASTGALIAVDAAAPACGPGRTCVAAAGISFVLPGGWSRTAPESDQLFAAWAGSDDDTFEVADGAGMLRDAGSAVPTDIDGVVTQASSLFEDARWLFSSLTGVSTQRTVLPVGPAVRVSYIHTVSFGSPPHHWTTVTEWFFINGRLVVLEYTRGYGHRTPDNPSSDPPEFTLLLESLRAL